METCSGSNTNQWRDHKGLSCPKHSHLQPETCICQQPRDSCQTEMVSCKIDASRNGLFKIAAASAARGSAVRTSWAKIRRVSEVSSTRCLLLTQHNKFHPNDDAPAENVTCMNIKYWQVIEKAMLRFIPKFHVSGWFRYNSGTQT